MKICKFASAVLLVCATSVGFLTTFAYAEGDPLLQKCMPTDPARRESWATSAATDVSKWGPATILSQGSWAQYWGNRIRNIRISVKASSATSGVSQMKVELAFVVARSPGEVSIGAIDFRHLPPVKVNDVLYFDYQFPAGIDVEGTFIVKMELGFDANVLASISGIRLPQCDASRKGGSVQRSSTQKSPK